MRRPAEPVLSSRVWWALLTLGVVGVVFLLFAKTLGNAWAYDDIDYINHSADYLAGKRGFWELLFRPQGEHLVALFRLLLLASLKLFGMSATPFRALTLLVHAATAVLLALLAQRYSGSRVAATTTALAYVLPCGFSTMWLWFPSGSCVPWAVAFYVAAMLAISAQATLGPGRARWIAFLCVVAALGFETTHAPLAAGPMLLDEYERRRDVKPKSPVGPFAIAVAALVAGTAWFSAHQYHQTFGPSVSISLRHGLPRAAYLLAMAPLRYFLPSTSPSTENIGLPYGLRAAGMGVALALPVLGLMIALWRRGLPSLARIAALAAIGPIGVVSLCGVGRWRNSYWDLDYAGRYLFTLLIPYALLAGALAASAVERRPQRARWVRPSLFGALALLLLVAANFALRHRAAMLARIPMGVYEAHAARYRQLGVLADELETAARALPPGAEPLAFPDSDLWLDGIHNGRISTRILMEIVVRDRSRLRLGGKQVSSRDQEILNPLLVRWARATGEPLPYLSIEDGRLRDAHFIYQADFRNAAQPDVVVDGFYDWDGHGRWMTERGTLRLRLPNPRLTFLLAAPLDALRRVDPTLQELSVDVSIIDSNVETRLGALHLTKDGQQQLRLDATPYMARFGSGRLVQIALRCSRTWVPAEVIPGSNDTRPMTVQVFLAGAEAPAS